MYRIRLGKRLAQCDQRGRPEPGIQLLGSHPRLEGSFGLSEPQPGQSEVGERGRQTGVREQGFGGTDDALLVAAHPEKGRGGVRQRRRMIGPDGQHLPVDQKRALGASGAHFGVALRDQLCGIRGRLLHPALHFVIGCSRGGLFDQGRPAVKTGRSARDDIAFASWTRRRHAFPSASSSHKPGRLREGYLGRTAGPCSMTPPVSFVVDDRELKTED